MTTASNDWEGEARQDRIHIVDPVLRQGFAQLPRLVLRAKDLSDKAKVVYALLLDYAWQQGSCFPGQERLARDLSTTERTIRRALDELKRYQLIEWKRRGLSQTNIYSILSLADNPQLLPNQAERTILSAQERTPVSAQNRTGMSDKVDPGEEDPDVNLRNSNGNADGNKETASSVGVGENPHHPPITHLGTRPPLPSMANRSPGFVPLVRTLVRVHSDLLVGTAEDGHHPHVSSPLRPPSDQLLACITEISQEFSDSHNLRSNLTRAQRLQSQSGLDDAVFVARLFEARAVTRDRQRKPDREAAGKAVAKAMPYFFSVAQDLLHLKQEPDAQRRRREE